MRVCIAQINTTPGDFAGNFSKIESGVQAAAAGNADILIFPELTIPGYLSQDLIYHSGYIDRCHYYLQRLVEISASLSSTLTIVVGYLDRSSKKIGKPFVNCAGVIRAGRLLHSYHKQLLPFYDVFDELRYFEPGSELVVFEVNGEKIGVVICEDLWNDKGGDSYSYEANPLARYLADGVRTIISLNSSPFIKNKLWSRIETIGRVVGDETTVIYVNQVGGQDELVFDGQSFVLRNGDLLYLNDTLFQDSYDTLDLVGTPVLCRSVSHKKNRDWVLSRACSLRDLLVQGLRDYAVKSGFDELVVASSGGVDSAVVCMLATEALGADRVHAIRMPSVFSSQHSRDDAALLHEQLGCWDYVVPIDHEATIKLLSELFGAHQEFPANLVTRRMRGGKYNKVADENIQARFRDLYVMHFSNAYGAMPLSTGNKTESACGYYTHFDMNFSFAPIKDLYKFEVLNLAKDDKRIPENIWRKPPSAELAEGQIDEQSLLAYAVLDPIVKSYIEDYISRFSDFVEWAQLKWGAHDAHDVISSDTAGLMAWLSEPGAEQDYLRITSMIGRMEYKRRQTCPGTKVSKVAFGIGRRIPIVEKWS